MRVGSAASRYPLTDSELVKTSCGKLVPLCIPRPEETTFDSVGVRRLSFAMAGALADIGSTVVHVKDHLEYAKEFNAICAVLDGPSLSHTSLRTALIAACRKLDTTDGTARRSKLAGLKEINVHVMKKLHSSSTTKIANGDTMAMNDFTADLQRQITGQKSRYGVIGGMQGAARRCIDAITSALAVYERALSREPSQMQARIDRKTWKLTWKNKTKECSFAIGETRESLRALADALTEAMRHPPGSPLTDETILQIVEPIIRNSKTKVNLPALQIVDMTRLPKLLNKTTLDSFKTQTKLHHGESYYESQPIPGCLHLLMRTVRAPALACPALPCPTPEVRGPPGTSPGTPPGTPCK